MTTPVILLATFNGSAYLEAFLDGLRRQTHRAWRLVVRDDGSTDGTRALVAAAAAGDRRITLLDDGGARLGVVQNFGALMHWALADGAPHVFFADQDDVWLPRKLERQLAALAADEARDGADRPLLVHTDLTVVDRELAPIHPSFARFAKVHRDADRLLDGLLFTNHVTGCATAINRALLELATPVPAETVMHDWWLALCAAALGRVRYLPESTILYRQHGGNQIGAERFWRRYNPLQPEARRRWRRSVDGFARSVGQWRALRRRIVERTGDADHPTVGRLEALAAPFAEPTSPWSRWTTLRELGGARLSYPRQALLAARLWSLRRTAA